MLGLPLHPLVVHATVVIVPLAAVTVILAVVVPRFRRWAGPMPMLLSLAALILTPLSTSSGETLEHSVPETRLVEEHAELGDQLIWFTAVLFILSATYWWLDRRRLATGPGAATRDRLRTLTSVVGVLAVVAALGTGVQVARIGHSGAKAAWSDSGAASTGP
ncbi:hypothetical protein GON03_17515 [Nocardioides sp. MAH-18]|uniref:DUF2231 domain-containing protein n=1 Tax=Nocardioides agri TaxID=2682843 RepID=A0A6L6XV97_9ACTN|nr:hypothetical protein [Nocardioides sp. CGMCC 1.13656]MVQ50988.1 hypothetical protein [Nocardioides sp. MAH-18]